MKNKAKLTIEIPNHIVREIEIHSKNLGFDRNDLIGLIIRFGVSTLHKQKEIKICAHDFKHQQFINHRFHTDETD